MEADLDDPKEFYFTTIQVTGERKKRRIWSLVQGDTRLRPVFRPGGPCITDYISIVHIPNYFAPTPNYTITLLGGIQAAGTSAIPAFVRDREKLKEIQRQAPAAGAWQAIVKVDLRTRNNPVFTVFDVALIGVNAEILKRWQAFPPTF